MRIRKAQRENSINKLFSALIILLPFLYQYRGIGSIVSFGEVLIILVTGLLVIQDFRGKVKAYDKLLLAFYIVSIVTTLVCMGFSYFSTSAAFTVILRLILYAIIVYLGRKHFDLSAVFGLYVNLAFLFSVYLILQYLYHYSTGGYLPIYVNYNLLFPPEARGATLATYYRWGFRASSLFLEASYFSLFTLPAVPLLLYRREKKITRSIELIVICIALVFSTANSALAGLIIIFTVYLFGRTEHLSSRKTMSRILIVVVAIGLIVMYFYFSENANFFARRFQSGGSLNNRIIRGLIVYKELPVFHKIFGVGLNNLEPYMLANNITTLYDEVNLNYSCSMVQTLDYSGIAGMIVFVGYLISLYRKMIKRKDSININSIVEADCVKPLFWLLIFILSYESILFTYRFCFLITMLNGVYVDTKRKGTNQ